MSREQIGSLKPWSSGSSDHGSGPPSSCSGTPVDAATPMSPRVIEGGLSNEEHGERVVQADASSSQVEPVPSTMLLFPGYSYHSVQNRLKDLSSRTTDFKALSELAHFRDRSAIIDLTQLHGCTLLRAPHGYGKSSIVSMLSYYYDIRHKEDFAYAFRLSEAMPTVGTPNNHFVLKLEFGHFNVQSPSFNLNDELNKALKRFIELYRSLLESEDWSELEDPDAARTLRNIILFGLPPRKRLVVLIDDYDSPYWAASKMTAEYPERRKEVQETLSNFFGSLLNWTTSGGIYSIFFTGTQQILSTVSRETWQDTYDIVRKKTTDKLVGFCEEDVLQIAHGLHWRFHALKMMELADEFLESEEAKMQLLHGAAWYKYSCRTVLDFFCRRLEEKGRGLTEEVDNLMIRFEDYLDAYPM
ncbi:hypothetical protein PQX77_006743 [Marasmius sp. AFHP31]|nr:hypothetical protein PQX77_006743 [Marasmius sp. AFHP31]